MSLFPLHILKVSITYLSQHLRTPPLPTKTDTFLNLFYQLGQAKFVYETKQPLNLSGITHNHTIYFSLTESGQWKRVEGSAYLNLSQIQLT